MPLYRVRALASSRMIYQCDIICIFVMPKKLKTINGDIINAKFPYN
ncbi:hypothetical protein T12_11471 [Trichinella patagoniensis]|uniref:Uncharacterized protein n=1 Tax=Trichinella patagoniensis TaxID=990121 RepID=A0A0V0YZD7_9BILA|nr:hypothetical protein T12_11471 [Trichinella patagoniensis]